MSYLGAWIMASDTKTKVRAGIYSCIGRLRSPLIVDPDISAKNLHKLQVELHIHDHQAQKSAYYKNRRQQTLQNCSQECSSWANLITSTKDG